MPLAYSKDPILASLQALTHTIQHPSLGLPLAPLPDSHVATLKQLTTLLTGITTPSTGPMASPTLAPAPALRAHYTEPALSIKTAGLTTVKTMLNSVISTPNGRLMTGDIEDFYLETPMEAKYYAYMHIPVSVIPDSMMTEYKLAPLIHKGLVYVKIRKGMYGLPQSGRLANDRLIKLLAPHGYHAPVPITPGLWKHTTKPISFSLVVDDFGIKYTARKDAQHLLDTLHLFYTVSADWDAKQYCGLTFEFYYIAHMCDVLSTPGYIERALQRFEHPPPSQSQHVPHVWVKPQYGANTQYVPQEDATAALDAT
jgi:hypothetical protein